MSHHYTQPEDTSTLQYQDTCIIIVLDETFQIYLLHHITIYKNFLLKSGELHYIRVDFDPF